MARILVVDDERDARDLVVRHLLADGYDVFAGADADEALAAVRSHGQPDVAVLDVDLPGTDGVALLGELRRHRPTLPAVFVTVLWSAEDIGRIRATGGTYLAKPFTADALRDAVRRCLPTATPEGAVTPEGAA